MGNDNIEFFTENHEFKIVLTKRQKVYSSAIFAKYICNIKFINSIGFEVLNIQCSEKEILNLIQTLYEFNINIGGILSDGVNFDSSNICYYLYLSIIDNNSYEYDYYKDKVSISIYEIDNIKGNILRLYNEVSFSYIEELIYYLYTLISDIPYLDKMTIESLNEFI